MLSHIQLFANPLGNDQMYLEFSGSQDISKHPNHPPTQDTCWAVTGHQASLEVANCHFLLQGIFLTQGWNPGLPHCEADALLSEPQRSPSKE